MRRAKEPCWTKLVLDALRGCDDFLNYRMLEKVTGGSVGQVNAACYHLRKRHAVDCVIEVNGVAWWYALPPESDDRSIIRTERTPEVNPRKRRRTTPGLSMSRRTVVDNVVRRMLHWKCSKGRNPGTNHPIEDLDMTTKTLAELRAAAYAAYAGHQHDVATNPDYAAVAKQEAAKQARKAAKARRDAAKAALAAKEANRAPGRLISTIGIADAVVKVYYRSEDREFVCRIPGRPEVDYFTNDKDDAMHTAWAMVRRVASQAS
jgi:hypothetical protein